MKQTIYNLTIHVNFINPPHRNYYSMIEQTKTIIIFQQNDTTNCSFNKEKLQTFYKNHCETKMFKKVSEFPFK